MMGSIISGITLLALGLITGAILAVIVIGAMIKKWDVMIYSEGGEYRISKHLKD